MNNASEAFKTAAGFSSWGLNSTISLFLFALLCLIGAYILKEQIKELRGGANVGNALKLFLRVAALVIIVAIFLL